MTYLELQTAVLTALIDTPTMVQDAVPRLVNQAIKELQQRFNFRVMQANEEYLTVGSSRTLSPAGMPDDFKEFRKRAFYTEFLGGNREIDILSDRASILRRWNTDDIGDPHQLLLDAGTLEVWPLPDGVSDYVDGQYRITMPYWKYIPDLQADGDTNWFTLNAVQYIINWATSEGFALDWDEKRSGWWRDRADKEALRVILTGKKEFYSQSDTLVPHQGALESPAMR
jgi:hypothetical protein